MLQIVLAAAMVLLMVTANSIRSKEITVKQAALQTEKVQVVAKHATTGNALVEKADAAAEDVTPSLFFHQAMPSFPCQFQ
jgi:hypothetical protein